MIHLLGRVLIIMLLMFANLYAPGVYSEVYRSYDLAGYQECMKYLGSVCSLTSRPVLHRFTNYRTSRNITGYTFEQQDGVVCGYPGAPALPDALCEKGYTITPDDFPEYVASHSPQPAKQCGSIIDVDNLSVGEEIDVIGTGEKLTYSTNRVQGRVIDYTLNIPAVRYPDQSRTDVNIRVDIEGQIFYKTFSASELAAKPRWKLIWNGKTALGVTTTGAAKATISYLDGASAATPSQMKAYVRMDLPVGGLKNQKMGLGGWGISSVHYYDSVRKWIYFGNGSIRAVEPQVLATDASGQLTDPLNNGTEVVVNVIFSQDGREAFVFDQLTGRHLQTQSTRTGKVLKSFTYNSDGALTAVRDAFGKQTTITRPTLSQIIVTAPTGQKTTINLNSIGLAGKVITPGARIYEIVYQNANGLITTFKNTAGVLSTFAYDARGYLTKDASSSGSSWNLNFSITPGIQNKSIKMTTAEGRIYSYSVEPQSDLNGIVRTEIYPASSAGLLKFEG